MDGYDDHVDCYHCVDGCVYTGRGNDVAHDGVDVNSDGYIDTDCTDDDDDDDDADGEVGGEYVDDDDDGNAACGDADGYDADADIDGKCDRINGANDDAYDRYADDTGYDMREDCGVDDAMYWLG